MDRRVGGRVVVLISGRGTNLQALIDASASHGDGRLDAAIVGVVSDRGRAQGLARAQAHGIPSRYLGHGDFHHRSVYDHALAAVVDAFTPDLIVLAGWMHILGPAFLDRFGGRVLNLHPALPGQFPGLGAIAAAYEAARRGQITQTGVMVHYATAEVDAGPVIASRVVPIDPSASLDALTDAVHAAEHQLIVEATGRALNPATSTE